MKRKILSLIALGTVLVAQAQIKMTYSSHGLMGGDSHNFVIAENANEGDAGKNVSWDFSSLKPTDKKLTSYMLEPSTLDKSNEMTPSNTVIQEFGNNFFFKVDKTGIEQYGTTACNTVTTYDKPFVKMKYPFTYGSNVNGTYSGVQKSSNSSINVSGTYELQGDAYGMLYLPSGITYKNVLRVKQTRTIQYNEGKDVTKEITYRWYAASVRYPILVIIKYENNGVSSVAQVAYYAKSGNQKSSELANDVAPLSDANIVVSPNPFSTDFIIDYNVVKTGKVTIDIYDNYGRFVSNILNETQGEGSHSISYNTAGKNIKSGIYHLRVSINGVVSSKEIIQL